MEESDRASLPSPVGGRTNPSARPQGLTQVEGESSSREDIYKMYGVSPKKKSRDQPDIIEIDDTDDTPRKKKGKPAFREPQIRSGGVILLSKLNPNLISYESILMFQSIMQIQKQYRCITHASTLFWDLEY